MSPRAAADSSAVRHNPAVCYTTLHDCCGDDVSYSHLATDLSHNQLPAISFITPNLIDDMHNGTVADDDKWLSRHLPTILNSTEYRNGLTVVFITWDEGEGGGYASGEPARINPVMLGAGRWASTPRFRWDIIVRAARKNFVI
jgi:Phosphoesterase family